MLCFKSCCRCLQILYDFLTRGSIFFILHWVPILRWSCSNPSTSYCLIATCPGPNQDHILSRTPEQPPNWSPHSQFSIQTAIIRLLNIKQILSFTCSSGFSSQVKLHPNSWPLAPSFLTTFPLFYLYSI